jgi:hypothetical protein
MRLIHIAGPAALVLALATPAAAQYTYPPEAASRQAVTSSDIQRLDDLLNDAARGASRLRVNDRESADRLQPRLDDLRDEVAYLRVRLRKEGTVSRDDYNDLRSRIDAVRNEMRPGPGSGYGTNERQARRSEVPAGTELDVRLDNALSSETTQPEERFTATTMVDLYQGEDLLVPAGSTLRGVVNSVTRASRTERKGAMTVAFDQIRVDGRTYPIHGTVTQAIESEGIRGEAGRIGAGAGVGAILGGILGGAKGALLGILIGGGGMVAATEGKDVDLPAGAVLRVRLEQPLMIR